MRTWASSERTNGSTASAAAGVAPTDAVAAHPWPQGEGYFWMAGESAQMRAIRKHLMREVGLPTSHYDVMGYWRGGAQRQPRAVRAQQGGDGLLRPQRSLAHVDRTDHLLLLGANPAASNGSIMTLGDPRGRIDEGGGGDRRIHAADSWFG